MEFFNKKSISDLGDSLKTANTEVEAILAEVVPPFPQEKKEEKWVWVEGYKATDKDMKCKDFQYEIGKEYSLPEGHNPVMCMTGFHLCRKLNDVFNYYEIGYNHRFFKVKALVKKETTENVQPPFPGVMWNQNNDKLVAKSIIFIKELSIDEIFKDTNIANFPLEYKEFAIEKGIEKAEKKFVKDRLTTAYGDKLAYYIVEHRDIETAELAYALADNDNLTLYEKLSLTFGINSANKCIGKF